MASAFGMAAFASGLAPDEAMLLLPVLEQAQRSVVLASSLHLCYLVAPVRNAIEPPWQYYNHVGFFCLMWF